MYYLEDGTLLYSPSDLTAFLGCRQSTALHFLRLCQKRQQLPLSVPEAEEDKELKLLQQKGYEHEAAYLQQLKDEGRQVVEIPQNLPLRQRAALTVQAARAGAEVIYQAVLLRAPWRGDADFLMRCSRPSGLGDYSYEVVDTKLARQADPKHLIQLCAYADLLKNLQGKRPDQVYLVLGDKQRYSFHLDDFFYYYSHAARRFEEYIASLRDRLDRSGMTGLEKLALAPPEPCAYCGFCAWSEHCAALWQRDDHLCLVAGMQRQQAEKLRRAGLASLAELAASAPDFPVPELNREVFARLRDQAALQLHKRRSGQDKYLLLPPEEKRGFLRLPRPDRGDLFFDMEGDPYYPERLEYLFGVYYQAENDWRFTPFWGHDHPGEKKAFQYFMAFVQERLARYPQAHIYHYNHYEVTALKRLACRYAVCEEQLDNLLRQARFVDLYQVVREGLRISEPAYSIKNLETFYMEKRGNAVANAGDSIVVYNAWREGGNDALLQEIADYNEVDCISTAKLRDWLLEIRPAELPWRDETPDGEVEEIAEAARRDWEIEYEKYSSRLLAGIEEFVPGGAPKGKPQTVRQLTAQLLEFHNRENKPYWWSIFDRMNKPDSELEDDAECIGGLRLLGKPVPESNSLVYAYRYPAQEFKLRLGANVKDVASGISAGTIVELDEAACLIKLKKGTKSGLLPEALSIGPGNPVEAKSLRSALYRYADRLLAYPTGPALQTSPDGPALQTGQISPTAGKYSPEAITALLAREAPRLKGKQPGQPLVSGRTDDLLRETTEAVASLDRSYLFIQGPPGAGKTHTSGHVIVELLRRGKKVGVASNSHKAVHNLLDKIEALACERRVNFTGYKKITAAHKETHYSSPHINCVESSSKMPLDGQLYAGTAWLFAHERLQQPGPLLDYLFIDEAGQVALANLTAMAGAAENLVLVGDQMQLGQPVQGTHPGRAGMSALEYLLGEQAVIAPERGVFLAETRRMRPGICGFISAAFYGGKLQAHPDTLKRCLLPSGSQPRLLPDEGIVLLAAEHSHCTQQSREEAELVSRLYLNLLGRPFRDQIGRSRPLAPEDILVVSPYNIQVNLLASLLPEGARVGTVDKFQGQEAPVLLLSLTSSSAEDLPRNLEFLYSKNRLNVAISRAQCLAVLVLNPRLLEAPCSSLDQMRLVNTFCHLHQYAGGFADLPELPDLPDPAGPAI